MNKKNLQTGNAHFIVIIVLVVALLGVLGFVFWQNFLNNPKGISDTKVVNDETTSISQPAADDIELTEMATASYGETTMSLKYPKSWKLDSDGDNNTLTSADGKVILSFTLAPPDGIGGTCADAAEANPVTDPIVSAKWAAIPGTSKAIFSAYISHVKPTSTSTTDLYTYSFAAVRNTDEIKNIKVGDSTCVPFIFANYIDLDVVSGATLRAVVRFSDLENDNSMRLDLTPDEIKTQFESANGEVAESIIESISVK